MTTTIEPQWYIPVFSSIDAAAFSNAVASGTFGRKIASITCDVTEYKQHLKIIEGRLQALGTETLGTENEPLQQEALIRVQHLLLRLKKPHDTKRFFDSVIPQKIIKTLHFDAHVTVALHTTHVPNPREEFYKEEDEKEIPEAEKMTFVSVKQNTLVLSPTLRKIVTDATLEKIISHSMLDGSFSTVTKFDFAKCPLLSTKAPMMIRALMPKLALSEFSSLNSRRFCNATLLVEDQEIPVNREFLFQHGGGYFKKHFDIDATTIKLEFGSADLVRDYIDYLIGKNSFSGKKNVLRLFEIATLSGKFLNIELLKTAEDQIGLCLESLAGDSENVSYQWLSEVNKRFNGEVPTLEQKLRTLAFQKIKNLASKDEAHKYMVLEYEMEKISRYPDFPDLSDICERLELEPELDKQMQDDVTKTVPYPTPMAQFLETVAEIYPKNYMALNLLGKLASALWVDKAVDEEKATTYFDRVPMSFATKRKLLLWQNSKPRGANGPHI